MTKLAEYDTVLVNGEQWPVAIATCCREYLVATLARIGRCGFCGEVPVVGQKEEQ